MTSSVANRSNPMPSDFSIKVMSVWRKVQVDHPTRDRIIWYVSFRDEYQNGYRGRCRLFGLYKILEGC